jgi:hypothetical protein
MATIRSVIRPAPGSDGPYFVTTEVNGAVSNVTTGVSTLAAAVNQARDDHAAALSGLTVSQVTISTQAN